MHAPNATARDPLTLTRPEFHPYSATAKSLHWIIVALLIVQYTIGFLMPEIRRNTTPEGLVGLHVSFGAIILALVLVRAGWRIVYGAPPAPPGLPVWQALASSTVHFLLYVLIIAIPILGWANASYRGWKISVFGVVPLPHLVPARNTLPPGAYSWGWTGDVHSLLAYVLLGAAALHILAALYHRFILRDRVLDRMLPAALAGR
jgi:cytochrome b561